MTSKFTFLLNIFAFVVGVLFIVLFCNGVGAFEVFSVILGISFILISCFSLISMFAKEKADFVPERRTNWMIIPDVGGLILGIVLVAAHEFFAEFLSAVFAVLLIVGAIYKLWGLYAIRKTVVYPKWFYIVPTVIFICGIVLFTIGINAVQKVLSLIIGIAFVAYAVNSLLEYIAYRRCVKAGMCGGPADGERKIIDIK